MVSKIVLKVDVSCEKCKKEVLEIVSGVEGVNKMEADPEKGTLTVIGEADAYAIITCLRKAKKNAQFVSVGPPPKKEGPKKPEPKKTDPKPCITFEWAKCPCPGGCYACRPICACSGGCYACRPVAFMPMEYHDPTPPLCSLM